MPNEQDQKTQKRKRHSNKNKDGKWTIQGERARNKKHKNTHFDPTPTGIVSLMGALGSPTTPFEAKEQNVVSPLQFKYGISQKMTTHEGVFYITLPTSKLASDGFLIPDQPNAEIDNSPIPQVSLEGMIDIPLTLQLLNEVAKLSSKRAELGQNTRGESQESVMHSSARNVLALAGIEVPKNGAHWVHFISQGYMKKQLAKNLGIGTKYANARMEMVNRPLEKLLKDPNGPAVLYITVVPTWVKGFEKIRLLETITMTIADGPQNNRSKFITFHDFDMCSNRKTSEQEINAYTDKLNNTFLSPEPTQSFLPGFQYAQSTLPKFNLHSMNTTFTPVKKSTPK